VTNTPYNTGTAKPILEKMIAIINAERIGINKEAR
jgi:hypothetical protein